MDNGKRGEIREVGGISRERGRGAQSTAGSLTTQPSRSLTWMRLLPQSATMMFPLESTATPVGALNCPLPSPWEPNLKRNSPSALYTWQGKGLGAGEVASGRGQGLRGGRVKPQG